MGFLSNLSLLPCLPVLCFPAALSPTVLCPPELRRSAHLTHPDLGIPFQMAAERSKGGVADASTLFSIDFSQPRCDFRSNLRTAILEDGPDVLLHSAFLPEVSSGCCQWNVDRIFHVPGWVYPRRAGLHCWGFLRSFGHPLKVASETDLQLKLDCSVLENYLRFTSA